MPARLNAPATKRDIRLYDADVDFLNGYLARHNLKLTEYVRDLVHRAANDKRKAIGLPLVPPA